MREKIDPTLKAEWEGQLEDLGLGNPEEPAPNSISLEGIGDYDIPSLLGPDMQPTLRAFRELPEKLKRGIIRDMRQCQKRGMAFPDIKERLKLVVRQSHHMAAMKPHATDVQPHASLEEQKLQKEVRRGRRRDATEELISNLELEMSDQSKPESVH